MWRIVIITLVREGIGWMYRPMGAHFTKSRFDETWRNLIKIYFPSAGWKYSSWAFICCKNLRKRWSWPVRRNSGSLQYLGFVPHETWTNFTVTVNTTSIYDLIETHMSYLHITSTWDMTYVDTICAEQEPRSRRAGEQRTCLTIKRSSAQERRTTERAAAAR